MPISPYLPSSDEGVLLNAAQRAHLLAYEPVIQALLAASVQHIEADMLCAYVVGELALGIQSAPRILRLWIVLDEHSDYELVMQDWLSPTERALAEQFSTLLDDVQIDLYAYGAILRDPEEFSPLAYMLITQAVCVWGADLAPELPSYSLQEERVRLAIANDDLVQLERDLQRTRRRLQAPSAARRQLAMRHACQHLLRCGAALVLEQVGAVTLDPAQQLADFARFYPEQAAEQARALDYLQHPPSPETFKAYLDGHGTWLLGHAQAWLARYNPLQDDFLMLSDEPDDLT